jgi:hypothetical protein
MYLLYIYYKSKRVPLKYRSFPLCSVICTVYTLHMLRDCPIFWISLEITNSVVYKWFSIGPVTDGSYCVWYHLGLKTFQDPTKIFKVWLLFVDLRVDILGSLFLNILINTSAIMTYAYIQITKYLSVFVFLERSQEVILSIYIIFILSKFQYFTSSKQI